MQISRPLTALIAATITIAMILMIVMVIDVAQAHPTKHPRNGPRVIDLQPPILNAIARCESGGDASIHNRQTGVAAGLAQFLPSTWDRRARLSGRTKLVGVDPTAATLAQQIRLFTEEYRANGTSPWNSSRSCWRSASQAPIKIFGDRQTGAPRKCKRSMRNKWGYSAKMARRICKTSKVTGTLGEHTGADT